MNSHSVVYSVIIPHKNSLGLLMRQVQSIPKRKDVEILVIDDNSDTVTSEQWQEFQNTFSHVHLNLSTVSKGAGGARNIGLSHATGKWVLFADADDFFYPNAFDQLDQWSDSNLDVIYFLCDSRAGQKLVLIQDRMPIIRKFINARDIGGLRFNSLVPWGKMIRRSIIEKHHIRFDEVEVSNDVMFSMRLGLRVENAEVIDTPLYCCTKNPDSLVFHKTPHRAKIRLEVYKRANDFLHSNRLDEYRIPFKRAAYTNLTVLLPDHPATFLKSLWKIRYKDDASTYFKEVAPFVWPFLYQYVACNMGQRTKHVLHPFKRFAPRKFR